MFTIKDMVNSTMDTATISNKNIMKQTAVIDYAFKKAQNEKKFSVKGDKFHLRVFVTEREMDNDTNMHGCTKKVADGIMENRMYLEGYIKLTNIGTVTDVHLKATSGVGCCECFGENLVCIEVDARLV